MVGYKPDDVSEYIWMQILSEMDLIFGDVVARNMRYVEYVESTVLDRLLHRKRTIKDPESQSASYRTATGFELRHKRLDYIRTLTSLGFFPFGSPDFGYHRDIMEKGEEYGFKDAGRFHITWDISGSNFGKRFKGNITGLDLSTYGNLGVGLSAVYLLLKNAIGSGHSAHVYVHPAIMWGDGTMKDASHPRGSIPDYEIRSGESVTTDVVPDMTVPFYDERGNIYKYDNPFSPGVGDGRHEASESPLNGISWYLYSVNEDDFVTMLQRVLSFDACGLESIMAGYPYAIRRPSIPSFGHGACEDNESALAMILQNIRNNRTETPDTVFYITDFGIAGQVLGTLQYLVEAGDMVEAYVLHLTDAISLTYIEKNISVYDAAYDFVSYFSTGSRTTIKEGDSVPIGDYTKIGANTALFMDLIIANPPEVPITMTLTFEEYSGDTVEKIVQIEPDFFPGQFLELEFENEVYGSRSVTIDIYPQPVNLHFILRQKPGEQAFMAMLGRLHIIEENIGKFVRKFKYITVDGNDIADLPLKLLSVANLI